MENNCIHLENVKHCCGSSSGGKKKPFATTSFMFQFDVNCFEQQKGKESAFKLQPIILTEMYVWGSTKDARQEGFD